MKKVLYLFLAWRVLLFIPLIFSRLFIAPREGYDYTLLTYFLNKDSQILSNFLLYPYGNFDASYYLQIAASGYTINAGFFPLFPLSIYLLSFIFNSILPYLVPQFFVGIFLASIYFALSLIFFYKLLRIDFKENIAFTSIIFLLIFPTSFFYAAIYSEGLFLLLSLISFYFARKKKWFWAGIAGAFLSATRLVGITILPALLWEYYFHEKKKSISKLLSILVVPFGLIIYSYYNFLKWGNPLYFIQAQGNFQNNRSVESIILPFQTIIRYFKILIGVNPYLYEWWVAFFELGFFLFASTMLYVAWKKRIRFSYILFGILCLLIPASTGTFSGIPRYVAVLFPMFIALALIKNKLFKVAYIAISAILLFIFFTLFSKGYFIA